MNMQTLISLVTGYSLVGMTLASWAHKSRQGAYGYDMPSVIFGLLYFGGMIAMAFIFAWWSPLVVVGLAMIAGFPLAIVLEILGINNTTSVLVGSALIILALTQVI